MCIVCGVGVLMGNRGGSSQNFSNVCSTAISFSEWIHHRTSQMFALQPFQIVKVLTSGFWRISTMWRSVRVGGVPVNNRGGWAARIAAFPSSFERLLALVSCHV